MNGFVNALTSQWLYRLIRLALGGIFLWAGMAKLFDVEAFAGIISAYELLPESLLVPVAIGLPIFELFAGLGLIFDVRGSLSITFGLLIMFAFVLWFGILKDLDIDCGCFSADELKKHDALRLALYRDLAMLAAASYLFLWRTTTRSFPRGGFFLRTIMAGNGLRRGLKETN